MRAPDSLDHVVAANVSHRPFGNDPPPATSIVYSRMLYDVNSYIAADKYNPKSAPTVQVNSGIPLLFQALSDHLNRRESFGPRAIQESRRIQEIGV